jgi:4-hydroxy-tetrahydrodipicolinate synthase
MEGGASGAISVTANVAPGLMSKMCSLALSGDLESALSADQKLQALHKRLFLESNPVPVKWALAKMGLIKAGIRLPLVGLDEEYHQQVIEALRDAEIAV